MTLFALMIGLAVIGCLTAIGAIIAFGAFALRVLSEKTDDQTQLPQAAQSA